MAISNRVTVIIVSQGSISIKVENKGKIVVNGNIKFFKNNQKKTSNIFKRVCPDIIFANKRTDKLMTLEK
jgi:hypothetical protein